MKKSLLCAAVFSSFATASMAADVQMFGFFDQGMAYLHEDLADTMGGPVGGKQAYLGENGKVAMAPGKSNLSQGTGNVSTWGVRGKEKISDDLTVGFHLEHAFLADTGALYNPNIFFERESSVYMDSNTWGQIKFGRMPAMTTGSGTTGLFNSRTNPFGAGWGNMTGGWKFVGTLATARHSNMINYKTPVMNGVQLHLQHSFGDDKTINGETYKEGSSKVNRFSALGVTVTGEKYFVAAAVDWLKMGSKTGGVQDDSYKAIVGGHYNFGAFKAYAAVEYMDNVQYIGGYSTKEFAPMTLTQKANGDLTKGFDGWAIALGADTQIAGGKAMFSVGYGFGENQNLTDNKDYSRFNVGLGYNYPLSKRTSVYAIGGYFWEDADFNEDEIYAHEVIVGMMHRF